MATTYSEWTKRVLLRNMHAEGVTSASRQLRRMVRRSTDEQEAIDLTIAVVCCDMVAETMARDYDDDERSD